MEEVVIRRELPNYKLPSESKGTLISILGRQIRGFKMGVFAPSFEAFINKEGLHYQDNPFKVPHGGPLFLSVKEGSTLGFNFDNLTSSIALREIECDLRDTQFLEYLYLQDIYVPIFLKAKTQIDSEPYYSVLNQKVESVAAYKYPNNHRGKPIGYDSINEVAVSFSLQDGLELVIMSGLSKRHTSTGVAVIEWADARDDCLNELERFWQAK